MKISQDPLQKLAEVWPYLSPWQKKALVMAAGAYAARARLNEIRLRPIHMLLPVTALQIFVFICAIVNAEYFAPIFSAGNLVIVGLAALPFTLRKKLLAHWV